MKNLEDKYLKDGTVIDKLDTKKSASPNQRGAMSHIANQVAATYMKQLSLRSKKSRSRTEYTSFLTVGYKGSVKLRLRSIVYIDPQTDAEKGLDLLEDERKRLIQISGDLVVMFDVGSRRHIPGWVVDIESTEGVWMGPMQGKVVLGYDIDMRVQNKSKDEIERTLEDVLKERGHPVD